MALEDIRKTLRAGVTRLSLSPYDDQGKLTGLAAAIVNGDRAGNGGTRQLVAVREVPFGYVNEPDEIAWAGDGSTVDSMLADSEDPADAIALTSEFDADVHAALTGMSTHLYGDMKFVPIDGVDLDYPVCMVIVQSRYVKVRDAGKSKIAAWAGQVITNTQIVPMHTSGASGRDPAQNQFKMTIGKSANAPWGDTINDQFGTCQAGVLDFTTEYPLEVHAWKGDAAETIFTMNYTPAAASGNKVVVWVDGVIQTYTTHYTVNVANRQITFVAAPAAGAQIVALYQFTSGCS